MYLTMVKYLSCARAFERHAPLAGSGKGLALRLDSFKVLYVRTCILQRCGDQVASMLCNPGQRNKSSHSLLVQVETCRDQCNQQCLS